MTFRMRWLGTACFEIVLPKGRTIVTDPYVDDSVSAPITSEEFEGCDYIFITHGHYDHVLDVGKLASRFSPKIFCSDVTASSLIEHQGVNPALLNRVTAGDVIHEEGLSVEVVRGMHLDFGREYERLTGRHLPDGTNKLMSTVKQFMKETLDTDWLPEQFMDWMARYPQGEQLNFVFAPTDGKRIYMAGSCPDPSLIEVARRAKAYITLLQVLPGNTLRGMEEQTARIAIASGCKIVVPQHYDPLLRGAKETDLSELKRILDEKSDIVFQELVPGQWYTFD